MFGTVLFCRLHGGVGDDRAMGLHINTLPVRLQLDGTTIRSAVRRTQALLAELLRHEHARSRSPSAAAACPPGPLLFAALLNYRHNSALTTDEPAAPIRSRAWKRSGRSGPTIPDTLGRGLCDALGLTAQVVQPHCPHRVCDSMACVLADLAQALEHAPERPVRSLAVLAPPERELLLQEWNRTEAAYPAEACIHHLFEAQVRATPEALALVHEQRSLSYAELNARANRLAHRLIAAGVEPASRRLRSERSSALVIAELATLKAARPTPVDPQRRGAPGLALQMWPACCSPTASTGAPLPAMRAMSIDAE